MGEVSSPKGEGKFEDGQGKVGYLKMVMEKLENLKVIREASGNLKVVREKSQNFVFLSVLCHRKNFHLPMNLPKCDFVHFFLRVHNIL